MMLTVLLGSHCGDAGDAGKESRGDAGTKEKKGKIGRPNQKKEITKIETNHPHKKKKFTAKDEDGVRKGAVRRRAMFGGRSARRTENKEERTKVVGSVLLLGESRIWFHSFVATV